MKQRIETAVIATVFGAFALITICGMIGVMSVPTVLGLAVCIAASGVVCATVTCTP